MAPMRDGVQLAANILLPKEAGPFPVILVRTPYGKADEKSGEAKFYAAAGYAMVAQDCRGRGSSQGEWDPFRHEGEDGFDTQEWVGRQPWCNGRIGTSGGSCVGWTQWAAAPRGSHYPSYTSAPLEKAMEVTGPVKVMLHAASSARDTDFTAKLLDVHPDGKAYNLCDGILRARYRESSTQPTLIEPGKTYRYEIDLWVTSNLFKPGHRVRLEISSSNFPRFDRNPNTGHEFGADAELAQAKQTVFHDRDRPSHVVLPIIPR